MLERKQVKINLRNIVSSNELHYDPIWYYLFAQEKSQIKNAKDAKNSVLQGSIAAVSFKSVRAVCLQAFQLFVFTKEAPELTRAARVGQRRSNKRN